MKHFTKSYSKVISLTLCFYILIPQRTKETIINITITVFYDVIPFITNIYAITSRYYSKFNRSSANIELFKHLRSNIKIHLFINNGVIPYFSSL